MTLSIASTTTLNNGVEMPRLGLGVYLSKPGDETKNAVECAIAAGYRHVDTAAVYRNEADVGKGIRRSGAPRDQVFVTTKVWNTDQGFEETLRACDASLDRLGLDYLDLYLVHWPMPAVMEETWRAMEAILHEGKARSIGVSNFLVHHLEQLFEFAETLPAVDQVEFHPHLQQPGLRSFLRAHGISMTAWSPLKRGEVVDMPEIVEIAERHERTPVQVVIRWMLQGGLITIPKSVHRERIMANASVYDFELSDADIEEIDALDRNERTGPHPDFFP